VPVNVSLKFRQIQERSINDKSRRYSDPSLAPLHDMRISERLCHGSHDSHSPRLAGSFAIWMTVKVTTDLGQVSASVEGP